MKTGHNRARASDFAPDRPAANPGLESGEPRSHYRQTSGGLQRQGTLVRCPERSRVVVLETWQQSADVCQQSWFSPTLCQFFNLEFQPRLKLFRSRIQIPALPGAENDS
jgi:hypothetical protein